MPHAIPREHSFNFYAPASQSSSKLDAAMQLPYPRMNNAPEHDPFRTAPRAPLTPPDLPGSAVRVVSLPLDQGSGNQYGYQLPAIGNSRSVAAPRSPSPPRQQTQAQETTQTPRKKWTISPNLRIPSTISTPQEGLPQLAAEVSSGPLPNKTFDLTLQVTCLFWFESSATLKQVVDTASPRQPLQPLVPDAHPTTGFRKWVATILTTTQVAQNVILLALLFIYRLKQTNPTVKGKPGSEYRLLTVALMLGNKFLDDNTYTNKTWAEVSGISVQEVHIMEVEFLSNMRYSLFTSQEKWTEWHGILGKFGTFFDRASKIPASGAVSPVGPQNMLGLPSNLVPSPPTQQQTSPSTSMMYSPTHMALSNTPLLQPQATSATVSPIGALPELGPIQRKRSADYSAEPPMKRQAHGFAPGPYSNAPLIPTLQTPINRSFEPPPSVNRLPPLPSLSIPPPQQAPPPQLKNWSELPLPVPGGRSMAMVYPPPVQWQQPSSTSTSSGPPQYPHTYTPSTDQSRQISPYPPSAGSSPTNASYLPTTSRQLSPSHFLDQRQSPYRPVRGVHTLLVPPPQTSIHNPARNIAYDQMQYQPLGRPMTDCRSGLLPYMDRSAWPETNQFNQLPVPQQPIFR
ncbi:cyclin pho80-like protein [Stemphylium lycopersici]|uniref:Cyclin pho80-like protein n=1 Tax=Stemphylium lycopersici TaxID=183478 RepID=A0A364N806_STELY|nr:cyclin pho80-like protein [Stemphylium lycopersici]RAR13429.1 cyclin pho80-like protein [Stemphylium lycopersici]